MNQMTGKPNHISIITLNVNGLNSSIKRHRLADWIKNKDPTICCLEETHLIEKDTHRLKVKGWGKTYHAHGLSKKAGVAILISYNVDFKPKLVRRDKEGHFILLKGSINQQDITIINIYAPNSGSSMYVKQILLNFRNQIDHNTIILGDFNTPLSPLDRSSRQKLNKETIDLNNTINNLDLTDIYRIYHPTKSEYTFFSTAHGSFSKIDHILCHKANVTKYKKIETLPCILSDHNGLKLEINERVKHRNYSNIWRLNNMLLYDEWITEDIRKEIKKFLGVNENKETSYQNLWDTMKAVLRGKFISWSAFNKRSETQQINDLTLQLKALEKEEQNSTKSSRRQEIVKLRAEINEIETKETIQKIDKINTRINHWDR
uniref:exodeoxyribonuclease III n=1 Tax=Sciurus vulgaris TaxID=55149 RepID=A0A8D2CPZ6_SCIVU